MNINNQSRKQQVSFPTSNWEERQRDAVVIVANLMHIYKEKLVASIARHWLQFILVLCVKNSARMSSLSLVRWDCWSVQHGREVFNMCGIATCTNAFAVNLVVHHQLELNTLWSQVNADMESIQLQVASVLESYLQIPCKSGEEKHGWSPWKMLSWSFLKGSSSLLSSRSIGRPHFSKLFRMRFLWLKKLQRQVQNAPIGWLTKHWWWCFEIWCLMWWTWKESECASGLGRWQCLSHNFQCTRLLCDYKSEAPSSIGSWMWWKIWPPAASHRSTEQSTLMTGKWPCLETNLSQTRNASQRHCHR